jgi:hypothetical protein
MEMAAAIHSGVHEMRVHAALAEISLLNTMIKSVPGSSGEDAGCSACHTADRVDSNRDAFLAKAAKLSQQVTAMLPLVHSAAERTSLDAIQGGISNWGRLYSQYLELAGHKDFRQRTISWSARSIRCCPESWRRRILSVPNN